MRIIFRDDDGTAVIGVPCTDVINPATGNNFTVEECAANTVPNGKKYKIVQDSDIPTDMSFRAAWTVDESDLTDGTGTFTGVLAQ